MIIFCQNISPKKRFHGYQLAMFYLPAYSLANNGVEIPERFKGITVTTPSIKATIFQNFYCYINVK